MEAAFPPKLSVPQNSKLQVQGCRCRHLFFKSLRQDTAFSRIGHHRKPRQGIENWRPQPAEALIELRAQASKHPRAARAVVTARASLPAGRLPMIGRNARTGMDLRANFIPLDHNGLAWRGPRQYKNAGRRNWRFREPPPSLIEMAGCFKDISQQVSRHQMRPRPDVSFVRRPVDREKPDWPPHWGLIESR